MADPHFAIPAVELRWALECLAAGDTVEEIAEWSCRPVDDWRQALGRSAQVTPRQREILTLWDSDLTQRQIAERLNASCEVVNNTLHRLRARGLPVRLGAAGRPVDRARA